MRDPNRIDRMLKQLAEAWLTFPDMRLGQLILNVTRSEDTSSLWDLEDDQIEHRLAEHSKLRVGVTGLRYVKRRWDESRSDRHVDFGASWWFFEIDHDCNVIRQVESYDNGTILAYNASHVSDTYSTLSVVPLERALLDYEFITDAEFNRQWQLRTNT